MLRSFISINKPPETVYKTETKTNTMPEHVNMHISNNDWNGTPYIKSITRFGYKHIKYLILCGSNWHITEINTRNFMTCTYVPGRFA